MGKQKVKELVNLLTDLYKDFVLTEIYTKDDTFACGYCYKYSVGEGIQLIIRKDISYLGETKEYYKELGERLQTVLDKLDYRDHPELLHNTYKHDLLSNFVENTIDKGDNYFVVDANISDCIVKLNKCDSIRTKFCCQGHFNVDESIGATYCSIPYILFETIDIDSILEVIKVKDTNVSISISCIDQYNSVYEVKIEPSSMYIDNYVSCRDDKFDESMEILFKNWIDNYLTNLVSMITSTT